MSIDDVKDFGIFAVNELLPRVSCTCNVLSLLSPYVKQRASLTHDTGNPTQVLCGSLKGGLGREVGEGFQREGLRACLWLIHVPVRHRPSQDHNYPPIKIDTF